MLPLTDDEAALLYITGMNGAEWYPVRKLRNGRWIIEDFRGWKGFPTVFKTKKAAVAQFEAWMDLARERYAEMRATDPNVIITAVGVRNND